MSDPKNNGGPAFPNVFENRSISGIVHTTVIDGMTLRDWFAGMAMSGMSRRLFGNDGIEQRSDASTLAFNAYAIADAMLAEREK